MYVYSFHIFFIETFFLLNEEEYNILILCNIIKYWNIFNEDYPQENLKYLPKI